MSNDKSEIETIEEKIKKGAKDVEEFADKVTADQEPNVVINEDALPAKSSTGEATKKGS